MTEAGQAAYPGVPDNVLHAAETTQSQAYKTTQTKPEWKWMISRDLWPWRAAERRGSSCKARRLKMIKSDCK